MWTLLGNLKFGDLQSYVCKITKDVHAFPGLFCAKTEGGEKRQKLQILAQAELNWPKWNKSYKLIKVGVIIFS